MKLRIQVLGDDLKVLAQTTSDLTTFAAGYNTNLNGAHAQQLQPTPDTFDSVEEGPASEPDTGTWSF